MKEETLRLRKEMRADFELTWGLQNHLSRQLETFAENSRQNSEQVKTLAEEFRSLADKVGNLGEEMVEQAKFIQSVAQHSHRTAGTMRQQGERFDRFLQAISEEYVEHTEFEAFEAKVEQRFSALEERFTG